MLPSFPPPAPVHPPMALACLQAHMLGYELVEEEGWALPIPVLEQKLAQAKADGVETRALVVINPGNPTGNTLSEANMKEIVHFCDKHGLVLMADEVYQENVYEQALPFLSFKKVVKEMGADSVQLVSFHSTSKGFLGECGLRGGYFELLNFDPDVQAQLLKLVSIGLCSNTLGQIATGLMVQPPKAGDASFASYQAEKDAILSSMKRRALMLVDGLNSLEGVSCNAPQGAMYAFPQITLPPRRSRPPRLRARCQTRSTRSRCSRRRALWSCRGADSGRSRARGTSARPSCLQRMRWHLSCSA